MGIAISIRLWLRAQMQNVNVNFLVGFYFLEVVFDNIVNNGVGDGGKWGSKGGRNV